MAHSIDEVRRLTAAAEKYKVVTQLGNQGHSKEDIRRLCEYIWAGAIGNVTETYSWAPTSRGGVGGRLPTKPVPKGLHWEQWIGPAHYPRLPRSPASRRLAKLVGVRQRLRRRLGLPQSRWSVHGLEPRPADEHRVHPAGRRLGGAISAPKRRSLELPRPGRHAAGEGPLVRRLLGGRCGRRQGQEERGREDAELSAAGAGVAEEIRPRSFRRGRDLRRRQGNHGHRQLLRGAPASCPRSNSAKPPSRRRNSPA